MSNATPLPAPDDNSYIWSANDFSNIITIGASAIASVLLVIFKSRCKTINLCWGLINCLREVQSESDEEEGDVAKANKERERLQKKKDENKLSSITGISAPTGLQRTLSEVPSLPKLQHTLSEVPTELSSIVLEPEPEPEPEPAPQPEPPKSTD